MRLLNSLLGLVCVCVLISACSSSYDEAREGNPDYVHEIDVSKEQHEQAVEVLAPDQVRAPRDVEPQPVQQNDEPKARDVMSRDSVQVFSGEDEVTPEQLTSPAFRTLASDGPSVQIIPLDAEMAKNLNITAQGRSVLDGVPVSSVDPDMLRPSSTPSPASKDDEYVTLRSGGNSQRIYFAYDSTVPDERSKQILKVVAQAIKADNRIFSIEGHASRESGINNATQRKIVNLQVAVDRAYSVSRLLIEYGVPASRIQVVGLGETYPSLAVDGLDTSAASRRVEITPAFEQP